MKIWKKGLLILTAAALVAGVFLVRHWFVSWPLRFQGELDRFSGKEHGSAFPRRKRKAGCIR